MDEFRNGERTLRSTAQILDLLRDGSRCRSSRPRHDRLEVEAARRDSDPRRRACFRSCSRRAKEIGVVEKDKRNAFHKYDYASIEAVGRPRPADCC
jgi:hypothetical protein